MFEHNQAFLTPIPMSLSRRNKVNSRWSLACIAMFKAVLGSAFCHVVALVSIWAALPGCRSPDVITSSTANSNLALPAKTVAALKKKAFAGDGNAATELWFHYSWGLDDDKQGLPWLRLAARLGDPVAKDWVETFRINQPSWYAKFKKDKTLPKPGD